MVTAVSVSFRYRSGISLCCATIAQGKKGAYCFSTARSRGWDHCAYFLVTKTSLLIDPQPYIKTNLLSTHCHRRGCGQLHGGPPGADGARQGHHRAVQW